MNAEEFYPFGEIAVVRLRSAGALTRMLSF
jgi:hypothetical protein